MIFIKNSISIIHPKSLRYLAIQLKDLIAEKLWMKIIIAMVIGVFAGIMLNDSTGLVSKNAGLTIGEWLALPGQLFLTIIQMIVIPLVFASIIRGIAASEDVEQLKKIGGRIVFYFILTTTVAIIIGLIIAFAIRPGNYIDTGMTGAITENNVENGVTETLDKSIPETIIGLLPSNPLNAMVEAQMLQVVIFAIIIGLALMALIPTQAKMLLELLGAIQEICMTVVKWAIKLAPYAVFGLLAQVTIKIGMEALLGMGIYVITVIAGLIILLCVYALLVYFIGGIKPGKFFKAIREVQLLAFSASSSAAVMPLSIETAEDKLDVRPSISQFIIPLGTSINMDGTALYQVVATIFLAQAFNIELSIFALILIALTTVGASIGSPATPGVGIVILATVLSSVGIPTTGIALILGVDRILDMSRTLVNVTGDLTASVVMDQWVGGKQDIMNEKLKDNELNKIREASGEDVIIDQKR